MGKGGCCLPPVLPLWVSSPPADKWGAEEVAAWLEALGLGEYRDIFIRHDIQGSELILLERRDLKVPLLSPHPAPGSVPRALQLLFFPPPGPGHHQSRPHEEDPAGHQGAQQPALGWRQHRGGPGTPLPPVCVCVEPPRLPCFVCSSPSAPGAAASHRAHGAGGTGAELWSLLATGVAGSLQEPGSWAAVWGQKQRFSSPPPSTSLSPDGYLSCVNIWRRDIYCCCWRGVIASGKEGRGVGPFQQHLQQPPGATHTIL